jgi:hypothetical protein
MQWRVLFYVNENGKRPVEEFLRKLPPGHQGKAMRAIDLLEQFGIFFNARMLQQSEAVNLQGCGS